MSAYVKKQKGHMLSFEAREMACHFVDEYIQKLKGKSREKKHVFLINSKITDVLSIFNVSEQDHSLKIQGYRAALQQLILETSPNHKHGSVKLSLKGTNQMDAEQ